MGVHDTARMTNRRPPPFPLACSVTAPHEKEGDGRQACIRRTQPPRHRPARTAPLTPAPPSRSSGCSPWAGSVFLWERGSSKRVFSLYFKNYYSKPQSSWSTRNEFHRKYFGCPGLLGAKKSPHPPKGGICSRSQVPRRIPGGGSQMSLEYHIQGGGWISNHPEKQGRDSELRGPPLLASNA